MSSDGQKPPRATNPAAQMQSWRHLHRWGALLVALLALWLGVTGTGMQVTDLRSIYTPLPATDANVRAMRESFDGPSDYAVRRTSDYLAKPLPVSADFPTMLERAIAGVRKTVGGAPLRYLDLRMAGDLPVGQAGVGDGYVQVDAATGRLVARLGQEPREDASPRSTRNWFKNLHRLTTFGDWIGILNLVAAIALATLIVTGLLIYLKLFQQRRKMRRPSPFWTAGGRWRYLHRSTSMICIVLLAWVTLTGAWLTVEGLYRSYDVARSSGKSPLFATPAPLDDARLTAMLITTLRSLRATDPDAPVKAIRLRNYGGYRQGVVVTGGGHSRQLVFNADTGAAMTETEPGYPHVHFPFGWQAHQWAKSLHRGDWFGLTGRWLDLLAGLAMIYLSISGAVMYWQMWTRRRLSGRDRLIWH